MLWNARLGTSWNALGCDIAGMCLQHAGLRRVGKPKSAILPEHAFEMPGLGDLGDPGPQYCYDVASECQAGGVFAAKRLPWQASLPALGLARLGLGSPWTACPEDSDRQGSQEWSPEGVRYEKNEKNEKMKIQKCLESLPN